MSEYLVTIFAASAISAISAFVFFSKRQEKVAAAAFGIILVSAIISPLLSIYRVIGEEDFYKTEQKDEDAFSEVVEESFCDGIESAVADKYSLSEEDISAEVFGFSKDSMSAEKIVITLRGKASFTDLVSIRHFIEENNLGKCEVLISFE